MDFQTDVIEKSYSTPVVVDFWAPWCGPCRVLGPVIEEMDANDDRWTLVKLNTEEEQEIASQFGIRSIPNVKMFSKGKVVAEFAGALPRHQIAQWLDEHIPSQDKEDWMNLVERIDDMVPEDQVNVLEQFLIQYPGHIDAKLLLSQKVALTKPDVALQLMADLKGDRKYYDLIEDIRSLEELYTSDFNQEDQNEALLLMASEAAKDGDYNRAVKTIIDVVMQNKSIRNELPRRASIAFFHLLGSSHPVTKQYRKLFDMALY